MNLIYCSHMSHELTPGVFAVDAVLTPSPSSTSLSLQYLAHIEVNLGDDADTERKSGAPSLVLIDNGLVRLKTDADGLPGYKSFAKSIITDLKTQWIKDGAPTSVLDGQGKPIVMDCDYSDKDNLDGLVMIMGLQGVDTASVRDRYNVSHNLTKAQVQQMVQDMVVYVATTFYRKWGMQEAVDAATSLAEIEAIIGMPLF